MALAAVAAGADGLMLECHPDPGLAKSDGFQALTPAELFGIVGRARAVALAVRGEVSAARADLPAAAPALSP
jgi:3-deoxy-7-phosphoheptulonate synthase